MVNDLSNTSNSKVEEIANVIHTQNNKESSKTLNPNRLLITWELKDNGKRQDIYERRREKINHLIMNWIKLKVAILKIDSQALIINEVNDFLIQVEVNDEDIMSVKIKCDCKFGGNKFKNKENLIINIVKWEVINFHKHFFKHIDYVIFDKMSLNKGNKIV